MKEGVPVDTVDAKISKLSLEELQSKLADAERNAQVYRDAIDSRKSEEINRRLEELRSLGWSPSGTRRTEKERKPRNEKPQGDRECPICKVKGHDARAHRSQGKDKKPFTPDELKKFAA